MKARLDITMDEKMPSDFSFSGPWWAVDFEVSEVPPNARADTSVKVKICPTGDRGRSRF